MFAGYTSTKKYIVLPVVCIVTSTSIIPGTRRNATTSTWYIVLRTVEHVAGPPDKHSNRTGTNPQQADKNQRPIAARTSTEIPD